MTCLITLAFLDKTWPETVIRDGDLHVLVIREIVTVAEKYCLVMVPQEVVGQGHACGAFRDIDEAVGAGLKRAVVDPHVGGTEDGDAVAVRQAATGRRRRQRCLRRLAVAHSEPVDI